MLGTDCRSSARLSPSPATSRTVSEPYHLQFVPVIHQQFLCAPIGLGYQQLRFLGKMPKDNSGRNGSPSWLNPLIATSALSVEGPRQEKRQPRIQHPGTDCPVGRIRALDNLPAWEAATGKGPASGDLRLETSRSRFPRGSASLGELTWSIICWNPWLKGRRPTPGPLSLSGKDRWPMAGIIPYCFTIE